VSVSNGVLGSSGPALAYLWRVTARQ